MKKLLLLLTLYCFIYSSTEDKLSVFTYCMKDIQEKVIKWHLLAKNIGYKTENFLKMFPYNKLFYINKNRKIKISTEQGKILYHETTSEDLLILKNDFRINNLLSNKAFVSFLEYALEKLAIMHDSYIETEEKFKKYFYVQARKLRKKLCIEDQKAIYDSLVKKIIKILEKKKSHALEKTYQI